MSTNDDIIAIMSHVLFVITWQLELSKRDSSAILVSLRNCRVRQDVTSQFNGSSRISAVAKGRFSDPDISRSVFINEYHMYFLENAIRNHRLTHSYYLGTIIMMLRFTVKIDKSSS